MVRFSVRLTPRGGRDAVESVGPDGALRVRVSAPPVNGAANGALLRLVAGELGVAPSAVHLEVGETSRVKRLSVDGVDGSTISDRWPGLRLTEGR